MRSKKSLSNLHSCNSYSTSRFFFFQDTVCNNNFQSYNLKSKQDVIKKSKPNVNRKISEKGCLPRKTFTFLDRQTTDYFVFRIFLRNRLSLRSTSHEITDTVIIVNSSISISTLRCYYIIGISECRLTCFHFNRGAMQLIIAGINNSLCKMQQVFIILDELSQNLTLDEYSRWILHGRSSTFLL